MGSGTWKSLRCKPLKNRINIVLTREKTRFDKKEFAKSIESGTGLFFMNIQTLLKLNRKFT